MPAYNAFYAQSGGVTPVINASAAGVIQTASLYPEHINKVYAGQDGIIGALTEDLIDTSLENAADIEALKSTPSGAFGSCRYKLKSIEEFRTQYERLAIHKIPAIRYHNYQTPWATQLLVSACRKRSTTTCHSRTAPPVLAQWQNT